jgi:hypothetical protein
MLAAVKEALLEPSYFALRVCPRAESLDWWLSARRALHEAPLPMRAILAGRTRVEVSADEAGAVLRWARGLDGWDPNAPAPVWIYPVAPVDAWP